MKRKFVCVCSRWKTGEGEESGMLVGMRQVRFGGRPVKVDDGAQLCYCNLSHATTHIVYEVKLGIVGGHPECRLGRNCIRMSENCIRLVVQSRTPRSAHQTHRQSFLRPDATFGRHSLLLLVSPSSVLISCRTRRDGHRA